MTLKPITVRIFDKDYRVACGEEDEASLLEAVDLLNDRMQEVRASGKVVGADRIAVTAALNIAHEAIEGGFGSDDVEVTGLSERLHSLQQKIDTALDKSRQVKI